MCGQCEWKACLKVGSLVPSNSAGDGCLLVCVSSLGAHPHHHQSETAGQQTVSDNVCVRLMINQPLLTRKNKLSTFFLTRSSWCSVEQLTIKSKTVNWSATATAIPPAGGFLVWQSVTSVCVFLSLSLKMRVVDRCPLPLSQLAVVETFLFCFH